MGKLQHSIVVVIAMSILSRWYNAQLPIYMGQIQTLQSQVRYAVYTHAPHVAGLQIRGPCGREHVRSKTTFLRQ
jgi:hypothetical protein